MIALNRYPKPKRREIARMWGKRSAVVLAAKRLERGVDADTLRYRAADDARGQVLREGRTYRGNGIVQHWKVIRSLAGRTDQRDVLINDALFRTCGLRRLPAWLR